MTKTYIEITTNILSSMTGDKQQHFIFYCISFPMESPSLLRLSCVEDKKCLICSQNLDDESKPYNFGKRGWRTLKLQGAN